MTKLKIDGVNYSIIRNLLIADLTPIEALQAAWAEYNPASSFQLRYGSGCIYAQDSHRLFVAYIA